MEYIIKLSAVCIIASVFSLVIKKVNPEFSLLLGIFTSVFCLFCIIKMYNSFLNYIRDWLRIVNIETEYFKPLLKCFGISVISKFTTGVCKDAGQTSIASVLELCCNIASVWCLIPLIQHLFDIFKITL